MDDQLNRQLDYLKSELCEIRNMLYGSGSSFRTLFSTLAPNNYYIIPKNTHKLNFVTSVMILDTNLDVVEMFVHINQDQSVYLESTLPVNNFTVIIA